MSVDTQVDGFLHYMSAERGSSKNTIDAYRNDLRGFCKFANGQNGHQPKAAEIDRELIVQYIGWLNDGPYAKATVARKVAAVKSFCAFLLSTTFN